MRKKVYGQSQQRNCPFCSRVATQQNTQGVLVCYQHQKESLAEIKCTCGKWLEQRSGKFGPYFHCDNCGNISFAKGMSMKGIVKQEPAGSTMMPVKEKVHVDPQEITISTDDVEYFD